MYCSDGHLRHIPMDSELLESFDDEGNYIWCSVPRENVVKAPQWLSHSLFVGAVLLLFIAIFGVGLALAIMTGVTK